MMSEQQQIGGPSGDLQSSAWHLGYQDGISGRAARGTNPQPEYLRGHRDGADDRYAATLHHKRGGLIHE